MHAPRFALKSDIWSTIARSTSCNYGWLRFVVQIIFGTVIATSFILIMLMVVGKSRDPKPSSRCSVINCRIICNDAPHYGQYEDDIINAASEADADCDSVVLTLIQPMLRNFQIPENWLSRMRANVRELSIVGGNIKYIAPHAFMSPFSSNIRVLLFEEIEITIWENDMFVGLSNLRKLFLRNCMLLNIRHGALTAVDDSLQCLDIKASNIWDPVNVTGSSRLLELSIVDFSSNIFRYNLRNESFTKLKACKVLFLNSCQIVSIESGTFDYLESIEVIYLNDNLLITVPIGLFDKILPRRPRIALQENFWHCDCLMKDLRNLIQKDVLIVDPMCHYPDAINGMTFSDFEGYCSTSHIVDTGNSDRQGTIISDPSMNNVSKIIYMNGACHENNSLTSNDNLSLRTMGPSGQQNCLLNRIYRADMKSITYTHIHSNEINNNWIRPAFFVQNNPYSMVEITSSPLPGYGLLWYQLSCEHIVYCVNTIPNTLKVFNVNLNGYFTFCPFNITSGRIKSTHCISYDLADIQRDKKFTSDYPEVVLFVCIALGCLMCGAICVYGLIQRNPSLLRGSDRVLLVKHRSVEALILPPKMPMKKILNEPSTRQIYEEKNIFILPHNLDTLTCQNFSRSVSVKSNVSNDVSYISAIQPTEEQLNEWRSTQIVKQIDKKSNETSPTSNVLPYTTSIHDRASYYSFHSDESIYEIPK